MVKIEKLLSLLAISHAVYGQCGNPMKIREIRSLSPDERGRFFKALQGIKENGDLDRLSKLHVDYASEIHGHPIFLVFHRLFVHDFAKSILKVDPGAPIPYWDWSLDATNPAISDVFTSSFCGGNGEGDGNCVKSGPMANWMMNIENKHCLARKFNRGNEISPFWPPEALLSMQKTCAQYGALSSGIENGCHGAVHLGISGDMSTMFAPNDPFFFLHHGMVDKLWYDWQMMGPEERFKMYDNSNYNDPPVSLDDQVPGYSGVLVRDVVDPRKEPMCYEFVDSGSSAASMRLMQEVEAKGGAGGAGPNPSAPAPPAVQEKTAVQEPIAEAGNAAEGGAPAQGNSASLDNLTSQVALLSDEETKGDAMRSLHDQQIAFLQNTIMGNLASSAGFGAIPILFKRNPLLRRMAYLVKRGDDDDTKGLGLEEILSTLANGLVGEDSLVGQILGNLGTALQILPLGLVRLLENVGEIADNVTGEVFDLLNLPKVDLSKLTDSERKIPDIQPLPDWWCEKNNLNSTYASEINTQIQSIIHGFNNVPGYYSPAVVYYAAKKYGAKPPHH